MMYVWIAIVILVLFLVWMIIRSYNLPKIEAERAKKVVARQDGWTKRVCARWGRQCDPKVEKEKSVRAGLKILQRIRGKRHGN